MGSHRHRTHLIGELRRCQLQAPNSEANRNSQRGSRRFADNKSKPNVAAATQNRSKILTDLSKTEDLQVPACQVPAAKQKKHNATYLADTQRVAARSSQQAASKIKLETCKK